MQRRIFVRPHWKDEFMEVNTEYMIALWPDVDLDVEKTTEFKLDGHDFRIEVGEIDAQRSDR